VEAARGHRHRAEPIALAQHDGEEGHAQRGADHEEPARVPHLGACLDVGSDHESRRVDQRDDRQAVRVAQLQEARELVGRLDVDRTGKVRRVVRHQTDRLPSMRAGAVWMPAPNPRATRSACRHRPARASLPACRRRAGDSRGRPRAGRARPAHPIARGPLEHRQVTLRARDRLRLVVDQHVDDAVGTCTTLGRSPPGGKRRDRRLRSSRDRPCRCWHRAWR